jgi:hypothetical protein
VSTTTNTAGAVQTTATPVTDNAINKAAQGLAGLVATSEQIPLVKTTLQTQFDSISHSSAAPLILALAGVVGTWFTQRGITVDNQAIVVSIGAALTGAGYAWQWISMKLRKPVSTVSAS